ncbi:MAG: nucleotide sugar dehydrogenase [Candidatus Hodarchaeales archaeon]|jgi:UDP-N-acetyl-D-glucosamine dehydrogenase
MKTVTIIGLGYVGLPLFCLTASTPGYRCYGVDIDSAKLQLIHQKKLTYEDEIVVNFYQEFHESFLLTTKAKDVVPESDIIIICVQTPVDKEFKPIFSPLISAAKSITPSLKKGQLIIVESTIYPGTIEEIILPVLEESGLIGGKDFFIAHCPERIDPGNKKWTLKNIPRVCGAMSTTGLNLTIDYYESIIDAEIFPFSSLKAAEACKVIENSFRDINIAFVNELAMSFDKMNIDVVEVIRGAATKPFAFMPHFPGSGVGGHCIPVDPYYLIKKAADLGFDHEFLKTARKINNYMPFYTVQLVEKLINESGRPFQTQVIGLMGIAFKKGIDDVRNSPFYVIKEELERKGSKILTFDPMAKNLSSASSLDELLAKSNFLILVTDHEEFLAISSQKFVENNIIGIIDGRNALSKEKIQESGILYHGIGRR